MLGFLALLTILAFLLNRKYSKKKRAKKPVRVEKSYDRSSAMKEMRPFLKRLQEAKTDDEKLMALMDLQGKFGKKYPELVEMWSRRGMKILE